MMLRSLLLATSLLSGKSLGATQVDIKTDFFLAGDKAYGFAQPVKVCCDAKVTFASLSRSGEYAVFVRNEPQATKEQIKSALIAGENEEELPAVSSLCVWSKKTERLTEVMRGNSKLIAFSRIEWISGADSALFWVGSPGDEFGNDAGQRTLYELDAKTGGKRQLALEGVGMGHIEVISNSVKPLAALVHVMEEPERPATVGEGRQQPKEPPVFVQFYRPGANLGPMIQLPDNAYPNGWNEGGTALSIAIPDWNDAGRRATRYMVVDSATGKLLPASKDGVGFHWQDDGPGMQGDDVLSLYPLFEESYPSEEMRAVYLVPTSTYGNSSSSKPSIGALVSAEAEYAELSLLHDGVLYVSRGVAMYRPLLELSKAEFEKSLTAAEKKKVMNRAKQVALGLIMYATDYDDNLPSNAVDWQELVEPYIKNKSLFEGFQYTFPGGDMLKVEYPMTTEMGFIPVAGGRIVAYLDGHVEFKPDRVTVVLYLLAIVCATSVLSNENAGVRIRARETTHSRSFRQARGP